MKTNILLLICSLSVVVGVGEIVARSKGIPLLFPDSPFAHRIGRDLFAAEGQRPCNKECVRLGFNTTLTLNNIGVRDIDHKREKPHGTKRIVMLGDSMTQGAQVPLEQTLFRQLQRILDEQTPDHWEVISLAVGGFGTLEEIIMFEEHGSTYNPDILILQTFMSNDVCDNAITGLGICHSTPFRPYAVRTGKGPLKRTTGEPLRNILRRYSALFVGVETAHLKMKYGVSGPLQPRMVAQVLNKQMVERRKSLPFPSYPSPLIRVPEDHQLPFIKQGWEVTELLLRELAGVLQRQGVPLIVFEVPPGEEIIHPANQWDAYSAALSLPLIRGYASERLGILFSDLDVPFLPLLKTFDDHREEVLPYWQNHLNPNGHRVAAEAIFEMLKAQNLIHVD